MKGSTKGFERESERAPKVFCLPESTNEEEFCPGDSKAVGRERKLVVPGFAAEKKNMIGNDSKKETAPSPGEVRF